MVDRDLFTPPYRHVADSLAARIAAGEIRPGDRVPSEAQIQLEFGVSRGTARRALAELRERNVIVTVPR